MKKNSQPHGALASLVAAIAFTFLAWVFFGRPLLAEDAPWTVSEWYLEHPRDLLFHLLGVTICVGVAAYYLRDSLRRNKAMREDGTARTVQPEHRETTQDSALRSTEP